MHVPLTEFNWTILKELLPFVSSKGILRGGETFVFVPKLIFN
jgi:hypothetical protein